MKKEATNELAAICKQLEITNQYLSSIQYLLLFGDKVNKKEHYSEMTTRLESVISSLDQKSLEEVHLHHQ